MGFDFDYSHAVILSTLPGFLAATTFTALYVFVDRPRFRDRYAGLLFGLGLIAMMGFGIPLLLSIVGPWIDDDEATLQQWFISIGIRSSGSIFMCYLLWVYLTPHKARNRLGRFAPTREEHPHAPDSR